MKAFLSVIEDFIIVAQNKREATKYAMNEKHFEKNKKDIPKDLYDRFKKNFKEFEAIQNELVAFMESEV